MKKKKLIIFTDIGDTIIDETTEVRIPPSHIVSHAECIPGAKETALRLYEEGYTIVMVADGFEESFHRMMDQHQLTKIFSAEIISRNIGYDKPSPKMFEAAMQALNLTDEDKYRVIMIGNNLERDINGANNYGIVSVMIDWSNKRRKIPERPDEVPDYIIHTPEELIPLVHTLEDRLEQGEKNLKTKFN